MSETEKTGFHVYEAITAVTLEMMFCIGKVLTQQIRYGKKSP